MLCFTNFYSGAQKKAEMPLGPTRMREVALGKKNPVYPIR